MAPTARLGGARDVAGAPNETGRPFRGSARQAEAEWRAEPYRSDSAEMWSASARWAASQDYVSPALAARLRAVRVERSERHPLEPDDLLHLLDGLEGSDVLVPVLLAATGGLRLGEVIALRGADVEATKGRIYVAGSRYHEEGESARKKPKGRKGRYAPLPERTLDALRAHRASQTERRIWLGERWCEHDLVCPRQDGRPYSPGGLSGIYGRRVKALGFEGVHFHDLRHTFASLLIAAGMDAASVAAILGHSSPRTTLAVYAHAFEAAVDRSAAVIESALSAAEGVRAVSNWPQNGHEGGVVVDFPGRKAGS